jgi:calcium/calmodulin-dependent protein kinase kinase 2
MKAVNKFKKLVAEKRPAIMSSILGDGESSRFTQPPLAMLQASKAPHLPHKSQSVTMFDRRAVEGALAVEGVHREIDLFQSPHGAAHHDDADQRAPSTMQPLKLNKGGKLDLLRGSPSHSVEGQSSQAHLSRASTGGEDEEQYLAFRPEHTPSNSDRWRSNDEAGRRGHARDPLADQLYLYIGPSTFSGASGNADRRASFAPGDQEDDMLIVSESPGAADIDIYETAYLEEIERIRQRVRDEGMDEEEATVYLTRRVDARLLAVGQLAGRFMAKGEEGLERFESATGWKDKRARVGDVSRALRAAAREEYEKRRQERRQKASMAATPADANKLSPVSTTAPEKQASPSPPPQPPKQLDGSGAESPVGGTARSRTSSMFAQAPFANRAIEKGKQAKTSFKSLMGMMKDKGNAPKDDNATR